MKLKFGADSVVFVGMILLKTNLLIIIVDGCESCFKCCAYNYCHKHSSCGNCKCESFTYCSSERCDGCCKYNWCQNDGACRDCCSLKELSHFSSTIKPIEINQISLEHESQPTSQPLIKSNNFITDEAYESSENTNLKTADITTITAFIDMASITAIFEASQISSSAQNNQLLTTSEEIITIETIQDTESKEISRKKTSLTIVEINTSIKSETGTKDNKISILLFNSKLYKSFEEIEETTQTTWFMKSFKLMESTQTSKIFVYSKSTVRDSTNMKKISSSIEISHLTKLFNSKTSNLMNKTSLSSKTLMHSTTFTTNLKSKMLTSTSFKIFLKTDLTEFILLTTKSTNVVSVLMHVNVTENQVFTDRAALYYFGMFLNCHETLLRFL